MRDSKNDNVRFKKSRSSKNDFRKRQNDKKTINDGRCPTIPIRVPTRKF